MPYNVVIYFNCLGLLIGCIQGESKEKLLSADYCPLGTDYWENHKLSPEIQNVSRGSFKSKEPPEIKATGYVVDSLESALWGFYKTDTFKDGCLLVCNLGDDSDTVAAIYGQLAGAFYGVSAIPDEWKNKIFYKSLIEVLSGELMCLSLRTKDLKCLVDTEWKEVDFSCHFKVLGAKYVSVKLKGFSFLEEKSRELVRRLKPCPKQFRDLSEVDSTISEIEFEYFKLEGVCPDLFIDFKTMWLSEKEKLALRLGRKLK